MTSTQNKAKIQGNNIILATKNQGKIKEMQQQLQDFGFIIANNEQINLPEVEETGLSFIENAILKARDAALNNPNFITIAEDSGLVVPKLNGEPGLYSARYSSLNSKFSPNPQLSSDKNNRDRLLFEMQHLSGDDRAAFYITTIALLRFTNDPDPIIAQGKCYGKIAFEEQGENGFGYDCIFISDDLGITFGQASDTQKNKISHRSRALNELKTKLDQI